MIPHLGNQEKHMRSISIAAIVLTMFGPELAAQQMTLPAGPTTAVLVNLTIKPDVQRQDFMKVAPDEVRMTVQAHLDGKILQWYGRSDGRGVMFIVNASTVDEAKGGDGAAAAVQGQAR